MTCATCGGSGRRRSSSGATYRCPDCHGGRPLRNYRVQMVNRYGNVVSLTIPATSELVAKDEFRERRGIDDGVPLDVTDLGPVPSGSSPSDDGSQ